MSERRQDLLVGLFVLIGLSALGVLVVLFGEAPEWLGGKRYIVRISFGDLSDVQEGTMLTMRGIQIGRVKGVEFKMREHPEQGAYVIAQIEEQYVIPAGSTARVRPAAIGFGRSDIQIEVPQGATGEALPTDGSAILPGSVGSPLDAFISEKVVATLEMATGHIGGLAKELTPVATDLHELMRIRPIDEVERARARGESLSPNLYSAVERLYRVLTHFDTVLGDPEVQSNVKVALANFRAISEEFQVAAHDIRAFAARGEEIGDKLERALDTTDEQLTTVGGKLARNADQLADVLDNVTKATADLAEGEGTMGKFLRDPKLYNEMVLTAQRLRELVVDMQKLIDKLDKKGLFSKG